MKKSAKRQEQNRDNQHLKTDGLSIERLDEIGILLAKLAILLVILLLLTQFALQFGPVRQLVTGIDRAEGEPLTLLLVFLHLGS
ncbi:hypothetical protein [Paenibacillus daejeonensis]|uniref:hypothetical protein n=1 Tax=Paenibacillus daejeonensis TaxID=135193 RepID=UPI000375A431|nr:hypothetical protein [Paenibacillus daejeonensis]